MLEGFLILLVVGLAGLLEMLLIGAELQAEETHQLMIARLPKIGGPT